MYLIDAVVNKTNSKEEWQDNAGLLTKPTIIVPRVITVDIIAECQRI